MKGAGLSPPGNCLRLPGSFLLLLLLLAPGGTGTFPEARGSIEPDTEPSSVPLPDLSNQAAGMRDPLYRRALDYLSRYRKDDLGQAVRLFNQILKTTPDFAPAHGGLAEARALRYLWGWDPDPDLLKQALESGKRGVKSGPDLADTHLGLGLAYLASERYTTALAELDRAVEIDSGSFRAHLYRGMLLRGLRRTEEVGEEAALLLKQDPSSAVAYALLGDHYQDSRKYTLARDSYLTAALLDQQLLWARLGLAAAYQKDLKFSAASKTYDFTMRDFPEEGLRCRIMAASLLVATQDYDGALAAYEAMAENETVSPPLLRRLMLAGRAYTLEKLGKPEEAEYYWTRLVEEFPENFDGAVRDREVVSQGYEGLVRYYDGKKEPKRSTALLEKGCRHEGMSFALYETLAGRLKDSGNLREAVSILKRGIHGAPPDLDLVGASQASLSVLRAVASGKGASTTRRDAAELLAELETRLDNASETSYVPHLNLARAEALLGRSEKAVTHLRKALEIGFRGSRELGKDPDFRAVSGDPEFRALIATP